MKKRSVDFLIILATVISLSSILSRVTGLFFFTAIGRTFGLSVNPTPYTRVDKILPNEMEHQLAFACEDDHGPGPWHFWDYHVRGTLPGPHRRTVGILHFFSLAQNTDRSPIADARFKKMNDFYFCHGGPLARWIGCGEAVKAIDYKWAQVDDGNVVPVTVRQPCSG